MDINKKTKKQIVDELRSRKVNWSGKIEESDFLNRFLDLSTLPSDDPRFNDMAADYWQHRVNNPDDWDDDWVFDDKRINLLGDNIVFQQFICELLHPAVRDADEAIALKDMMNYYLKKDGYQLFEDKQYYEPGLSTYKIALINPTQIEKSFKTTNDFVHEAYEKIDKRLRDEDYSGAVTSSRTLLEYAIKDIYFQVTGDELEKIIDLQGGFKKIQKLIKLDYDKTTNENIQILLRSYATIVASLAPVFNSMADRHATKSTAHRNSAQFCTDSVKIFVNFIYGRMSNVHGLYPSLYEKLIKILDSKIRSKSREDLLKNKEVAQVLEYCDDYLASLLVNKLVSDFSIDSFKSSDIFLAFLRIFYTAINEKVLFNILTAHKDNNQTAGFDKFLSNLHQEKPDIFSTRVMLIISESKYLEFDTPDDREVGIK